MAVTVAYIPDDFVLMTGPRLIGHLLHFMLFGVLSLQVYIYAVGLPKDLKFNKVCVLIVYILEVIQSGMMGQMAFYVFGTGYGKPSYYDTIGPTWLSIPLLSGLVACVAQVFYARRISLLSRSYLVAGVVLVLSTIQLGGAIGAAVLFKEAGLFSRLFGQHYLRQHYLITTGIWNGAGALCDVVISVSMAYYLSRRRSEGLLSTRLALKKLIRLAIETGMITAVVAIMNFVLAILPRHPSFSEATSEILAEVYANSMMLVLNSRIRTVIEEVDTPIQRPNWDAVVPNPQAYAIKNGIKITTEEIIFPSGAEITKDDQMSQISSVFFGFATSYVLYATLNAAVRSSYMTAGCCHYW